MFLGSVVFLLVLFFQVLKLLAPAVAGGKDPP